MNSSDIKNIQSISLKTKLAQDLLNEVNATLSSYKALGSEIFKYDLENPRTKEVNQVIHYDKTGWITGAEFWVPELEDYIYTNRADLDYRFSATLAKMQEALDLHLLESREAKRLARQTPDE